MQKEKDQKSNEREFLPDPKENIAEGVKIFAEKASDIFNRFYEGVREIAGSAIEKGSEVIETVSVTAQSYIEKYRDRNEMKQLVKHRDEVCNQLGYMCYLEYQGRYRFREEFLKSDEFKDLLAQVRTLDKQIVEIGQRLEKESA